MRAAGRVVRARGIQREFQKQQRSGGLFGAVAPAASGGGEESGYGATGPVYRVVAEVAAAAAAASSEGWKRCGQGGSLATRSVGDYGFLPFATRGASSSANTSPSPAGMICRYSSIGGIPGFGVIHTITLPPPPWPEFCARNLVSHWSNLPIAGHSFSRRAEVEGGSRKLLAEEMPFHFFWMHLPTFDREFLLSKLIHIGGDMIEVVLGLHMC